MMLEKVKEAVKKNDLIRKGDRILLGVSGGPDSVALLYVLNSLKKEWRLSLRVAHLDHMLRKDSAKDKEFVESLCRKLKIPLVTAQVNIKEIAKRGSLEEVARNARLGFFFKAAKDIKAKKIALGHNLDDQAETVLMRVLRGTGLYGLGGISPKRKIAGYEIIRPLIGVRRHEIEAFLKQKRIKPRRDPTNRQDIYFRNKIRNRLLPLLEKEFNKSVRDSLSYLAQSAADDYDYLSQRARLSFKSVRGPGEKIDLRKLRKLHAAMQRLILRLMIQKAQGDLRRITFTHIREIEDLIFNRPVHSIVDLPKGVSVIKKKDTLSFYKR